MNINILRLIIAVLAMMVVGSALVIAGRYLWSAWRIGRAPGRILARHVAEVALGTSGLALGYAAGVVEQLGRQVHLTAVPRLWLYLVSMILLLIGMVEVGTYQRIRARSYPKRQAQVRDAVRAALQGRRVTGARGADRAAVFVTNAVLELEGTPTLPEPEPVAPRRETAPAAPRGRHALRQHDDRGDVR